METRDRYIFLDRDTEFQGKISTDHLILEGVIKGEVYASEDVLLKHGAVVQGKISTQRYKGEEGSIHKGRLSLNDTLKDLGRPFKQEKVPGILKSQKDGKPEVDSIPSFVESLK